MYACSSLKNFNFGTRVCATDRWGWGRAMARFDVLNCQSGSLAVDWPTFLMLAVMQTPSPLLPSGSPPPWWTLHYISPVLCFLKTTLSKPIKMKNLFRYVFDANPQTQDRALFDSVSQNREKQTCKRKDQKLPKEFRVKLGFGLPK